MSSNITLYDVLMLAKEKIDFAVLQNEGLLKNEWYFSNEIAITLGNSIKETALANKKLSYEVLMKLCELTQKEYMEEYSY